jgi:drug/metabolite transporter (DMT)-like permease
MNPKLLILAVAVNAVIGQLFLKRALISIGRSPTFATLPDFLVLAAKSPWFYVSLAIQGLGYLLWMILISRMKLGVATASVAAGFYVLMALCAWAVYGEALTALQWLGIGFITIGVACVSLGPV